MTMRKWYQYRLVDMFAVTVAVACTLAGVSLLGVPHLPLVLIVLMPLLIMWIFRLHPFLAGTIGGALGGPVGAGVLLMLGHRFPPFGVTHPPADSTEILTSYITLGVLGGFVIACGFRLLIAVVRLIMHR